MIKILKHLKLIDFLLIIVSIGFIVLQVWLDLEIPDYMSKITIILTEDSNNVSGILSNGGMMVLLALASLASAVIVGYIMAKVAARFSENLRNKMFNKIGDFSNDEMNKFSTESLITRTTNDVTQVQTFITMGAQLLIKAPIMAVWALMKISTKGKEWTWATLITLVAMSLVIGFIMIFVIPKFRRIQKVTDDLTGSTRENLNGVRVVRAYNAEKFQEEKFDKVNKELTGINLFTSRGMSILNPFMQFLMNCLTMSIFIIGAILINNVTNNDPVALFTSRQNLFADMMVFSQYAMQVIMAYMMLVMIFILLPRASVSAKRINEVMNTTPSIVGGSVTKGNDGLKGEIEFKNVSFKYPDAEEYILKDISFKVNKGQTVAFIGSTGSGKSTLINLVPRFYDVTEGEVLINGVNVKDYETKSLNNLLGYVPQKSVLFRGTIASNVTYGSNGKEALTENEIWQALEIAQGKDFVEKTENQLENEIAQGGTNLSGGQKQRVAIARAVARDPEIFIFDDSFSALDYKTDRVLRTALKKNTKGSTSLIVAQRIGTIIDADQIVVLDKGRVVGIGKHRELLKTCSVYSEIAHSQLTEEELA